MSPEQSRPDRMPSFQQANAAYAEVTNHNRQHASTSAATSNLMQALLGETESTDGHNPDIPPLSIKETHASINHKLEQGAVEGDMRGELVEITNADTFTRIGIKIAPWDSTMVDTPGERSASATLLPIIQNPELFKDFLGTIQPEDVADIKNQDLLSGALKSLSRTVRACFDIEKLNELEPKLQQAVKQHGEKALRTFLTIDPEYKRLGLDADSLRRKHSIRPEGVGRSLLAYSAPQAAKDEETVRIAAHEMYETAHARANMYEGMETFVTWWGRDILPEHIYATEKRYLLEPDSSHFGPSEWHTDGWQRNWRPALAFVDSLDREERTQSFGQEVRQSLGFSLNTALTENDTPTEYQRNDLINVRNAITGQPHNIEQFERYTAK